MLPNIENPCALNLTITNTCWFVFVIFRHTHFFFQLNVGDQSSYLSKINDGLNCIVVKL
jgi:hypothetical protein